MPTFDFCYTPDEFNLLPTFCVIAGRCGDECGRIEGWRVTAQLFWWGIAMQIERKESL